MSSGYPTNMGVLLYQRAARCREGRLAILAYANAAANE